MESAGTATETTPRGKELVREARERENPSERAGAKAREKEGERPPASPASTPAATAARRALALREAV